MIKVISFSLVICVLLFQVERCHVAGDAGDPPGVDLDIIPETPASKVVPSNIAKAIPKTVPLPKGLSPQMQQKAQEFAKCLDKYVRLLYNQGVMMSGAAQFGDFTIQDGNSLDSAVKIGTTTAASLAALAANYIAGLFKQSLISFVQAMSNIK